MYVFLYVYVYPNENSHRHTRQTSSDTRIQTDVGYECRLRGGGVGWQDLRERHPWPIFVPLASSINYIYTRCLKLTPDSPFILLSHPSIFVSIECRMLPVIFTACLLPLEYRNEIGFVIASDEWIAVSFWLLVPFIACHSPRRIPNSSCLLFRRFLHCFPCHRNYSVTMEIEIQINL